MDASSGRRAGGPTAQGAEGTARDGAGETLGSTGEFGVIDQITRELPTSPAVSVGVGDDAAVYLVNGSAVTSTDMLVEGVHFRRDWSSAHDVGRKAVAENVADLEAMGATPVTMVVCLGAPADLPMDWVRELSAGMRAEAELSGICLVGGDTTRARDVTIAVTVIGQTDGREPVLRSGARPGQVVAVKGRLGWAAAGLAVLARGFRSPRAAVDAQRVPTVPYGAGREAARAGAGAMIDISDGLLADLGHVAHASGVVVELLGDHIPLDEPVRAVAAATGADPLALALGGGEDHALAATFEATSVPEGWQVIGEVRAPRGDEQPQVLVDQKAWEGDAGWDHFGRR